MDHKPPITRREFLKLLGANMAAVAIRDDGYGSIRQPGGWPWLQPDQLPPWVRAILQRIPKTYMALNGYLFLFGADGLLQGKVPLAQTRWNIERSRPGDRLDGNVPWGIVLHWFGDREDFDKTKTGYLRGFNSIRELDGYSTRTSAHFLVGATEPSIYETDGGGSIGILQTQVPALGGTPYVASHIAPVNYQAHYDKKQYFVRALYQLGYEEPTIHSLLQDIYDGPRMDPNMRTIAVEITGYDFENPEKRPSSGQIANVVSVVWAIMRRYGIFAINILGHNEIQLGKPDPGKKFLALIRYLIGVKALIENNKKMMQLVFGQFLGEEGDRRSAVRKYFKFIRDYLVLVSVPHQVYEWEAVCNYGFLYDLISGHNPWLRVADNFRMPIYGNISTPGNRFLIPENHEGVDLYAEDSKRSFSQSKSKAVHLVAKGTCIFAGEGAGSYGEKTAIFRHLQPDGAEVLSIFGHLSELSDVKVGERYPQNFRVGKIESEFSYRDPYLHFAVAYGATWDTDLSTKPIIPLNAGAIWIRYRYLHPLEYLRNTIDSRPNLLENRPPPGG